LTPEINEENIKEDEDLLHIESGAEEDIGDYFMDFGAYLEARSSGEIKGGEKYVLSIEK
jgi:hypothetical protein